MIFVKTFSSAILLSSISATAALGRTLQSSTLLPFPSEKATRFRQAFRVGNGNEFTEDEIETMESIYNANTPSFAPNNEAKSVTTNCTVFRQALYDTESVLSVDYVMTFESNYYSVENYTRLFQNWTNLNLETIQMQMNLLSINVTEINEASRIVVSTPSPTTTPDSTPNKNELMDDVDNTVDSSSAPDTSTTAPTVLSSENEDMSLSWKSTKFRQGFRVGNGTEFTEDEIDIIESIYNANTINFAPDNEVESVTTNCTVYRQQVALPEDDELDTESVLSVDFVMIFESNYYSVENYTRMFQNWTNLNLVKVQEQMNLLKINVTEVDKVSRVVIATPSPTKSPSPTTTPDPTTNKNEMMMDDIDNTVDSSSAPVTSTKAPTVSSSKNEDSSSAPIACFMTLSLQAIIGLFVVPSLF